MARNFDSAASTATTSFQHVFDDLGWSLSRLSATCLACVLALPSAATAAGDAGALPERGGELRRDRAFDPITDTPGLPRVLIIGDSISIGYTLSTRELLRGVANVHRVPENAASTKEGVARVDVWLASGKWDVIHFNWGLHDLKHWKDGRLDLEGPRVSTVPEYERALRALVTRLKATGAKLIFATTTPVPKGSNGRVAGDEREYNAAARRVMKQTKVAVDDLHTFAASRLAQIQKPMNVHFTPEGSALLAVQVAASIRRALPAKR